ncbi:MAG: hypothetical protein J5965_00705, partial [Aeriscardovia sp.]|nr:hypothetical protein [Aeriscardovia sp.]
REMLATFATNATCSLVADYMVFNPQHLATFRNKTGSLQQIGVFCNMIGCLLQNFVFVFY